MEIYLPADMDRIIFSDLLKKRWFPPLIGLLLVVFLSAFIITLYLQIRRMEIPSGPPGPEEISKAVIPPLISRPGNPVKKSIAEGKIGFAYELLGSFTKGVAVDETRPDKAWRGQFVLRGDPLKREIPVFLGVPTGTVVFGRFEGSFAGRSVWNSVAAEEMALEIKAGEPVQLVVEYSLPDLSSAESVPEYFRDIQRVIDGLSGEFDSGEYTMNIPEGFSLLSRGVGVVR